MWFSLEPGATHRLRLIDEQSVWPAPNGSDAELVITTVVDLRQEVVLATPRVCRLQYTIESLQATMLIGDEAPAPWPDASRITGRSFELMLTDRGPLMVPSEGGKLPNRLASWLETVSEDMRSCWPIPPADCAAGTQWESIPAVPGGLPPGARSAKIKIRYQVVAIRGDIVEVGIKFGIRVVIKPPRSTRSYKASGRGEVSVELNRNGGLVSASRRGVMEIERPDNTRNQLVRAMMRVTTLQ